MLIPRASRLASAMRFNIDEVEVYFPYDYIYSEQYSYMVELKRILDARGHGLLEMPSGTGKTVTLLAFIVAYQQAHPEKSRLIYCSRTVPEIDKALYELKRLIKYREECIGVKMKFLGLGLSSRKNLCINTDVNREKNGKVVDARCRDLTASFVRQRAQRHSGENVKLCTFFENIEDAAATEGGQLSMPAGVYTIDDLIDYGKSHMQCPYFLARKMIHFANVVIFSYHYMLDPKVAEMVSKEMPRDCIVIFDEAHNIDNVCIESLSIDLTRPNVEAGARSLQRLTNRISEIKQTDANRLREEYTRLVEGLRRTNESRIADDIMANPVLPDDLLQEAVPGNIRKAEHFVALLRRFVEYLRTKLKTPHVVSESPASFLQNVREVTMIERKPLRFCSGRLASLVKTLELRNLDEYSALQKVANFATVVSTYSKGFLLILEPFEDQAPNVPNPVLHLCCLDATIAIKPVFARFESVVITSGTLSPLDMYPKILDFSPVLMKSFPMTLTRNSVQPLIVTRGGDQVAISSRFEVRNDPAVVRNFGTMLIEFSRCTPDGLVCFFPSYIYMESIVAMWQEMGIISEAMKYKLVFVETPDGAETALALANYRLACDNGRGAVLLSVARGKVSEGIDFDHHYGRAVLMFGVPYQYTESRILKARLEYLRTQFQIRENDFLTFDALRQAAQCIGRVLRGKNDYGLMVLADKRYARLDKRAKLPRWINEAIVESHANLSTEMAIQLAKRFFREMAQKSDPQTQKGLALLTEEDIVAKEEIRHSEFMEY